MEEQNFYKYCLDNNISVIKGLYISHENEYYGITGLKAYHNINYTVDWVKNFKTKEELFNGIVNHYKNSKQIEQEQQKKSRKL